MEIKREALSRRDDARIKLNKAKDELANLKSEEVIVSNDHLEDYVRLVPLLGSASHSGLQQLLFFAMCFAL